MLLRSKVQGFWHLFNCLLIYNVVGPIAVDIQDKRNLHDHDPLLLEAVDGLDIDLNGFSLSCCFILEICSAISSEYS